MFILTINGKEDEGAYSVKNEDNEQVLYLFDDEDDAVRYAMMLENDSFPEMHVIEVDSDLMLKTCQSHGYLYTIITKDDIVIPPKQHDII